MLTICGHSFLENIMPPKPRVLDVGARNFEFSRKIRERWPEAEILALEPDKVTPPIDVPNIRFQNVALIGDGREWSRYVQFSTGEGNYITERYEELSDQHTSCFVPCVDIRDITRAEYLEKWDLVKLDCEGSEFSILENWPRGGIARQITVEFHDYKNPERWNLAYFDWLWTQLPDYKVVRHERTKQGEAWGHWDSLLIRLDSLLLKED